MNILLLNWQDIRNPLGGGAEVHYHEIFRRLVQRGHSVTLFCSSFPGSAPFETIDGITVIRRGTRNTFNITVYHTYRTLLANRPYDIVVDDLNKIPFYTPLFVRKPLLTIVHHLFGGSIFKEAPLPAALYVWGAERAAIPLYRDGRFAVVSESTKAELIRNGVSDGRIHIAGNAVDHDLYRPMEIDRRKGLTIGYLGRMKKYKSVDHLLRAFAIVRRTRSDVRLVVVGDGDVRPGLESLAKELGIVEAVEFLGYVDQKRKVEVLNACDIVANPSAKEGWGLTVIEANACGVPVVASDVPGLRDSVLHGKTGTLYPYGDIQALSRSLVDLLDDEPLRKSYGREAQAWAQRFTWEHSADAMEKALEEAKQDGGG